MGQADYAGLPGERDAQSVLNLLASRHSVRSFTGAGISRETLDSVIRDAIEAPSACNHQMWHFVVVQEPEMKKHLHRIAGANRHFLDAAALVVLCFHKGWNHNKFAVVQSVAAATYHMMLSAHVRGYGTVWNAGIGNAVKVREALGIPGSFEVIGILAIGVIGESAPKIKAPRRPLDVIRSYERFERDPRAVYPLKRAERRGFFEMLNHKNACSVFDPEAWGWDRIANFRSYAVYAKSPVAGVYVSKRLGKEIGTELDGLQDVPEGGRVLEVMPYGGSYTAEILRRFGERMRLYVADLSEHNLAFVRERVRQEGFGLDEGRTALLSGGRLALDDETFDAVILPQVLEAVPEPSRLVEECWRVLRRGGYLVISVRNVLSWFGPYYFARVKRGTVPNFGPYIPRTRAWLVRLMAGRRGRRTWYGISASPWVIGRKETGWKALFCRLMVVTLRKE